MNQSMDEKDKKREIELSPVQKQSNLKATLNSNEILIKNEGASPTNIEQKIKEGPISTNNKTVSFPFLNGEKKVNTHVTENLLNEFKIQNHSSEENSFFLTCYDPKDNEIFFFDFVTEKVIYKPPYEQIKTELREKLNEYCSKFKTKWNEIKDLTNFDTDFYISKNDIAMKFFQRPLSSKFLYPESLGLNHFTSTYPLPAAFSNYKHISLEITIDISVSGSSITSQLVFPKKVSFFYVVDTIIKETLRSLMANIQTRIDSNQQEAEDELNTLKNNIKNRDKKFVMKMKSFEEFMFGDYPICTYESIRSKVREFEPIKLILMMKNKSKVNPNITHYPPIIYIPIKDDFDYNILLEKYLKLFNNESIIFKFKPLSELQEFYFKKPLERREKLTKYCESGECDFPFTINIKGISNFFSLKKHMDNEKYHDSDLPYFVHVPSVDEEKKKKNIFFKIAEKICAFCSCKKKNIDEEKKQEKEKDEHAITPQELHHKYKQNLKLQKKLNYLQIKNYQKKVKKIINYFTLISYKSVEERINELTKESSIIDSKKQSRFELNKYKLPFLPAFIKIEAIMMYGSYEIIKLVSRLYIISDEIKMNEKINFNNLLFSHLPRETRICFNIIGFHRNQEKKIVLGCGQCPIFNENGVMENKTIEIFIWPFFKIDPRIISMSQYYGKYHQIQNDKDEKVINYEFVKKDYCILSIEFPKFVKPLAYILKTPNSYREFLKIKNSINENRAVNDLNEIKDIYSSSMNDLEEIVDSLRDKDNYFLRVEKQRKQNEEIKLIEHERNRSKSLANNKQSDDDEKAKLKDSSKFSDKDKKSHDIWEKLNNFLDHVKTIIVKDPLEPLEDIDRKSVLWCRDYICTIPSALEVFLRSINWFNPMQVNLAKIYIKRWAKIDPEDAISLLDARYPDTHVREYAVSILSEMTDDLLNLYMLQMCQSLMYELYHVTPLSDFLIEKSLKSPNLIGSSFYWNATVCMNNKLIKERLSIITTQILMLSGGEHFKNTKNSKEIDSKLKVISQECKKLSLITTKVENKELLIQKINELKMENFRMPIHASYYGAKFKADNCCLFSSKMVPMKLACESTDTDHSIFNVIYKCGDDLRQDVLTLQILKIMDKMWLDSNLDLKITAYKVLPTGLKEGFMEFVEGQDVSEIQNNEGVGGALDRELILKFLRTSGQPPNVAQKYDSANQHDNFIKSMAGFCVATCVLGIGDRHPGNVKIKKNGIFFHIDYGHILGNFKYKFGIKRERAPFLLTPDMAHVYTKTNREDEFKDHCVKAYIILRKNASRLMNLFIIMSSAGLPELSGIHDVDYLKKMLKLDKVNEEDAGNYFIGLINQSKNEKFRLIDNMIHNLKHG